MRNTGASLAMWTCSVIILLIRCLSWNCQYKCWNIIKRNNPMLEYIVCYWKEQTDQYHLSVSCSTNAFVRLSTWYLLHCHITRPSRLSVRSECGRLVVRIPIGLSQRLKNWHLLLPWLVFTIFKRPRAGLAQCQFKVTGWDIMFICGMVLQRADTLKPGMDQVQQIWQPLSYVALNCW